MRYYKVLQEKFGPNDSVTNPAGVFDVTFSRKWLMVFACWRFLQKSSIRDVWQGPNKPLILKLVNKELLIAYDARYDAHHPPKLNMCITTCIVYKHWQYTSL